MPCCASRKQLVGDREYLEAAPQQVNIQAPPLLHFPPEFAARLVGKYNELW